VRLAEADEGMLPPSRYSARAGCLEDEVHIGALWQTPESESEKQTNIVMPSQTLLISEITTSETNANN